MVTRQEPYAGEHPEDVRRSVYSGKRLPIPNSCPEYMKKLIEMCWLSDPEQRPSFQRIVHILHANYDLDRGVQDIHKHLHIYEPGKPTSVSGAMTINSSPMQTGSFANGSSDQFTPHRLDL